MPGRSIIMGKIKRTAIGSETAMKITKSAVITGALLVVFLAGSVIGRRNAIRSQTEAQPQRSSAVEQSEIPPPSPVLLAGIPDVRQSTGFSCGAAALQAVLAYWGIEEREDRLIARLHSTPEQGTHPDDIVRVSREFGLKAELREGLGLEDLEAALRTGVTVIVDLQAWRDKSERPWSEDWEDGHYMILLGIDAQNLYFEDPSLLGSRGIIPRPEFVERWHDYEGDPPLDSRDRKYVHMAVFVQGDRPAAPPPFALVR
jgi:predicted double-glycine peptidase